MDKKEIIKRWKGNQRYTLKLIKSMPAKNVNYQPVPEVKTFESQVRHLTTWLRTHSRFVTDNEMEKQKFGRLEDAVKGLEDFFNGLLMYLEDTTDEDLSKQVKVFYGTVSKSFILQTMDNHISHHRGQMIVYLRLNGIKPPSYVGW